jgi:hypothetical protein
MDRRVPGGIAGYSLAWSEEFDGVAGSPADPGTWLAETGGHGWGNDELISEDLRLRVRQRMRTYSQVVSAGITSECQSYVVPGSRAMFSETTNGCPLGLIGFLLRRVRPRRR